MPFSNHVPVPQRWHGAADVPEHPTLHSLNDRSVLRLLTEALYAQRNHGQLPTCAFEMMSAVDGSYDDDGDVINAADYPPLVTDPQWIEAAAEAERLLAEHPWLESLLAHHAKIAEQRVGMFAIDHLYDGGMFWEGDPLAFLLEFVDDAGTLMWNPERARDDAHRERIEASRGAFMNRLVRDRDPALVEMATDAYEDGVADGRGEYREAEYVIPWTGVGVVGALTLMGGALLGWAVRARRS